MIVAVATVMTTMVLVTTTITSFATTVNKSSVRVEGSSSQKMNQYQVLNSNMGKGMTKCYTDAMS